MKKLLKAILLTVAFLIVIKSCSPLLGINSPLVGKMAPDFTLNSLNGQQINMAAYRNGQPAILYFWATWCPHCKKQLLELTKNKNSIESSGIKILAIDIEESALHVQNYINENGIQFNVILDLDGAVTEEYMIVGVPTYFFLDREGNVIEARNDLPDNYASILLGEIP